MSNDIKTNMSSATSAGFYVTGGTVPRDSPSYVVRQADQQLLEALRSRQFCYVLTSRQMGKSSLMVRTVSRLRQEIITCIVLDLTSIGQNLTEEQWYDGLLNRIAVQLDLEDELDAFWAKRGRLGPLQRWVQALEMVVLASVPGQIVLFVDEIDAVRSLPFSTDEFFAAIRSCYNRRTEDEAFKRLTFCLLGVATPADLIHDTRSTPFNIGTRIELQDFTEQEALLLAPGLEGERALGAETEALGVSALGVGYSKTSAPVYNRPAPNTHEYPRIPTKTSNALTPNAMTPNALRLLSRILHWTGGHPYLTQRLCAAVAAQRARESSLSFEDSVDSACAELFLSPAARLRDDNLLFVRECLLRGDTDRAALLEKYAGIRSGRRVKDDETNRLISILHLSGIIRTDKQYLTVRNRIYSETFDKIWIRASMPDAELRRQKMAFQRGFIRATALGLGLVSLTGWLAWMAMRQSHEAHLQATRADHEAARARLEMEHALKATDTAQRNLYAADMALAQQAWNDKDYQRVKRLLDRYQFVSGQPDLRGFEWWLLWTRGHFDMTIIQDSKLASTLAYSKDGTTVRTRDVQGNVLLWNAYNGWQESKEIHTEFLPYAVAEASDLYHKGIEVRSPNRRYQAEGTHYVEEEKQALLHTSALLRDLKTNHTTVLQGAMGPFTFSPDNRLLATENNTGDIQIWDTASGKRFTTLFGSSAPMVFSPDSKRLAAESFAYGWAIKVFDVFHNREPHALDGSSDAVAVSLAGNRVATVDSDWNGVTIRTEYDQRILRHIPGASDPIAISPDGRTLAAGIRFGKGKVGLWDTTTGKQFRTLPLDFVTLEPMGLVFSDDNKLLATHAFNGTITVWNMATGNPVREFNGMGIPAFSRDGRWIAFEEGSESPTAARRVVIYDLATNRLVRTLPGATAPVAFSPLEPLLVTGGSNSPLELWDTRTWTTRLADFNGPRYRVHTVTFTPDGQRIVAGDSGTYNIIFWDVTSGRETYHIPGRTERTDVPSYSFGFSQDGMRFYSGNQDGVTKVWGTK